jgi:glyoxylase-like metal-dependent hydrolase (beta-lactamase superfamily II)
VQIGRYQVRAVIDAFFGLDGGAMFGIVPRPLWEREQPPDERNRIRLACRCLLLRGDNRAILLDTGIGDKWSARERDIYAIEPVGGGLPASLAGLGLEPTAITDVIQTHLHFDHAGGLTRAMDGAVPGDDDPDATVPTYPAATLHVQRRNWEWAHAPTPRDAGSYRAVDWAAYDRDGAALHLVDGAEPILPGIEAVPTDGHTPGQQAIRVRGAAGEPDLIFCGDLFPTHSHLRLPWNMGYDLAPLIILEEKLAVLQEASSAGHVLALEHDPVVDAAYVRFDGRRTEIVQRLDLGGTP